MADVAARACPRYGAVNGAGAGRRIQQLIEAEAWTEAVLALINLELPQWRVRRLDYEDGLWHCALSRWQGLPAELDETAEASHDILPLSILSALIEARRELGANAERPKSVPQLRAIDGVAACCDNFA